MPCKAFNLKWADQNIIEVISASGDQHSPVSMTERLLESETALEYGISFDSTWYNIPLISREVMIAGRIGRQWISSLQDKEAAANVRSR
jgi:hypothetical protein